MEEEYEDRPAADAMDVDEPQFGAAPIRTAPIEQLVPPPRPASIFISLIYCLLVLRAPVAAYGELHSARHGSLAWRRGRPRDDPGSDSVLGQ